MTTPTLRDKLNALAYNAGKVAGNPLMPSDARRVITDTVVLLIELVDRLEALEKSHQSVKTEVLGRIW